MSWAGGGSSTGEIKAWLKVYDGARFRSEMDRSAKSVDHVGTAAESAAAKLGVASRGATSFLTRIGSVGTRLQGFGRQFTTHVGLPLLAIGALSGHLAVNFEAAMTRIQTQAGGSAREVAALRGEVLDLARKMPQSPEELAGGLYHIESIGIRGAKALRVLKIAAEGAAVGNANLEDTASALGGAWLTNIKGAGNLRHVMGLLNATVGAGNIRFEDLVQALGTGVLPAAKVAGLGIRDVFSALAVFTDENMQGSSAMAQFSTALHFLYAPTAKAAKALRSIGLESAALAKDMHKPRGLLLALTHLHERLRGMSKVQQEVKLGEILPGGRGRVLLVLLNQLERLQAKYRQIAGTAGKFPSALAKTKREPRFRLKSAESSLQASGIELGAAILPAVVPLAERLAHIVTRLAAGFEHLSPGMRQFVLGLGAVLIVAGPVATVIGFLISGAATLASGVAILAGVITAFGFAVAGIILGVVALAAAVVIAYRKVGWFHDAVDAVWDAIVAGAKWIAHAVIDAWNWIAKAAGRVFAFIGDHWKMLLLMIGGPILLVAVVAVRHFWGQIQSAFGAVVGFIRKHWVLIAGFLTAGIVPAIKFVVDHFGQIKDAFRAAVGGMARIFGAAFHAVKGAIVAAINWIIDKINWVVERYNDFAGSIPILGGDLKFSTLEHIGGSGGSGDAATGKIPSGLAHPDIFNPFPKRHRKPRAKTSRSVNPLGLSRLALAGGPNDEIHVHADIDGREVARAIKKRGEDDRARRNG